MSHINKYLRNFKPYKLASHKVWCIDDAERRNVLKLDWNESTIPPSPMVDKRIKKLLERECFYNLYPATMNNELLEALSQYTGLPTDNIQYFGSSDNLHEYIAKMYINVGDPVLILWPSYDNFRLTAEVNGANVFYTKPDENYIFSKETIINDIEKIEPSLVYLCNPNNPTGFLHEKAFLEEMVERFPDVVFLIDEAYWEFSGITLQDYVVNHDNLLISRTMSKAFGIANFRFGYLIASEKNIKHISSIRNPKNITTFAQEAALGVLQDVDYMKNYVKEVCAAKTYFVEQLDKWSDAFKVYPSAGNFVMLAFDNQDNKECFVQYLETRDVFVRNLSQDESVLNCARITIGTKKQMERVVSVINEYIQGK